MRGEFFSTPFYVILQVMLASITRKQIVIGMSIFLVLIISIALFYLEDHQRTDESKSTEVTETLVVDPIINTISTSSNEVVATDTSPVEDDSKGVQKNDVTMISTSNEPKPKLPITEETPLVNQPKEATPMTSQDVPITSFNHSKMLKLHNDARQSVGVPPLIWSEALAVGAQTWSDQLKTESCKFRHDPGTPHGENIYWGWVSGNKSFEGLVSSPEEAVKLWVDEKAFYNYEKNTCTPGEQCGHYTQIVWKDTTSVGCAVSSCKTNDKQTDIWVCRYSPAGNDGSRPY